MHTLAALAAIPFAVMALALIVALWLLPTIIAVRRKAPNIGVIVVINVLLGWTLIGWVGALAFAVVDQQREHN
jgi:Superinfection immunity protein